MRSRHPYLEVINVGQGDCMILRPSKNCALSGTTYIIDTGDGKTDISRHLDGDDKNLSLVLTHSHKDHIGGLCYLFSVVDRIRQIIIPYYHNEIVLISKALENLMGIDQLADDCWPLNHLNEYGISNAMLNRLSSHLPSRPKIIFGHEGFSLCNHFTFFNPPRFSAAESDKYIARIENVILLFNDRFAALLKYWLNARLVDGQMSDTPQLDRGAIHGQTYPSQEELKSKGLFVLSFLESNYQRMLSFTQKPTIYKLTGIVRSLDLTANQASLVFRFETSDCFSESILFTGDIDTSVFRRIIASGHDISSEVLKVPHHGSRTGLDSYILNQIAPKYAIISHSNKKFGRSKDPHPNWEIINLLQSYHISIHVTNDVIKSGRVVLHRQKGFGNIFETI